MRFYIATLGKLSYNSLVYWHYIGIIYGLLPNYS